VTCNNAPRFRARRSFWLFFASALVACGCATAPLYNPYTVPREEFRRLVRTIGLLPPGVALPGEQRKLVAVELERALTEGFQQRGYRVIGSDVVGPVWRRYASEIGGLFNPLTGEPIEEKVELVRKYVGRELARSHNVDALAVTWTRKAVYYLRSGAPPWPEFLGERMHLDGRPILDMPLRVLVSRIGFLIIEPDGRTLYAVSIPVQWTAVFVARSYYERPYAELFPAERVRAAARGLLEDLEPAQSPSASETLPNNPTGKANTH
jgi:hypothetical protein